MDENAIREMTEEECWERLRAQEFGRLAYHLLDEVHIVPVNYRVDGHRLLFATAEGSKLLGVVMNEDVAFEVDQFADEQAWSVVVRGRARVLEEDEAHVTERVGLHTWLDTPKYNVVAIDVDTVSGRSFQLDRPWLSILSPVR